MVIAKTAFRERLRKKEFYIVLFIGLLILAVFGSGTGSLSINGIAITDYKLLMPVFVIVVNAICCILTVVMSMGTIPNEYERRTSHLIWVRKVSQARYHGELMAANIFSSLTAEALLFVGLGIFVVMHKGVAELPRLIPAYLIIAINMIILAAFTSLVSIVLNKFAAGVISFIVALFGIFHGALLLLKDMLGGFGGILIKYLSKLIPDLNTIQNQAGNVLAGKEPDLHIIFVGLLFAYIYIILVLIVKRKEA